MFIRYNNTIKTLLIHECDVCKCHRTLADGGGHYYTTLHRKEKIIIVRNTDYRQVQNNVGHINISLLFSQKQFIALPSYLTLQVFLGCNILWKPTNAQLRSCSGKFNYIPMFQLYFLKLKYLSACHIVLVLVSRLVFFLISIFFDEIRFDDDYSKLLEYLNNSMHFYWDRCPWTFTLRWPLMNVCKTPQPRGHL